MSTKGTAMSDADSANFKASALAHAIRLIRRGGEEAGLREHVARLQHRLASAWTNTVSRNQFKGLGAAIANARDTLDEMEATLAALKDLDPNNS